MNPETTKPPATGDEGTAETSAGGGGVSINGWDERDYKLWSEIRMLPSYGLIAPDDQMISLKQVLALLKKKAEERHAAYLLNLS